MQKKKKTLPIGSVAEMLWCFGNKIKDIKGHLKSSQCEGKKNDKLFSGSVPVLEFLCQFTLAFL